MTPREQALILRLAAAEIAGEARSIIVLRRTLADLGWSDAGMTTATTRLRATVGTVRAVQAELFERAA